MEIPHVILTLIAQYHADLVLTELFETLLWKFRYHRNIIYVECLRICCIEEHGYWNTAYAFAIIKYLKKTSVF